MESGPARFATPFAYTYDFGVCGAYLVWWFVLGIILQCVTLIACTCPYLLTSQDSYRLCFEVIAYALKFLVYLVSASLSLHYF